MSYMYVWRMYTALHIYTHGIFFAGNCGIILVHGLDKSIKPWFSLIHTTPSFKPAFHRDKKNVNTVFQQKRLYAYKYALQCSV